jgi:exosortase/archaeosortase family protein
MIGRERLKGVAWFLIKLNLLSIPLWIVMRLNPSFPALQAFVALLVETVLKPLPLTRSGHFLMLSLNGSHAFVIDFDCTGWKSFWFLTSLLIASESRLWEKLRFLAIGFAVLFGINLLRIATTIWAAYSFGLAYLEVVHSLLWREGLMLAVLGLWLLWLRTSSQLPRKRDSLWCSSPSKASNT